MMSVIEQQNQIFGKKLNIFSKTQHNSKRLFNNNACYMCFLTLFIVFSPLFSFCIMAGKENYVNVYKGFYIGEVLPTPKKIRYTGSYLPIYKGKEKKSTACIVVGKNASNIERLAAMELSAQTGYLLSERNETNSPLLKIQDTSKDIDNYDVIISIGQINTNKLNARYNEKYGLNVTVNYPGKEGYIVKTIKENGKTFIFCIGSDARGSYYAIQSILQLMNKQGSDIVLKESEIVDWPSFKIRGAFEEYAGLFSPLRYRYYELAQWLPKYKLNTFAFGRARKGENWRKPKKEYLDFIKKVCSYAKATQALDVLFMVRPYSHDGLNDSLNVNALDTEDIQKIIEQFRFALVNGASSLCIRHDDITKPLPEEEKKFFGNYANAHLSLFQNISNGLKDYSNFNFFFVPMHYQGYRLNSSIGKSYLEQIGNKLPQNVFIFWTGPTTKSKNIQQKDFQRFSNAIKRNPVLWDNTIYAHNGKYGYHRTLSCYLFDLFSSKYPQDFYKTTEGILYNGGNGDEIYKVARINTADYLWNPDIYNPESSLKKALAAIGGSEQVDVLLDFRDIFYDIYDLSSPYASALDITYDKILDLEKKLSIVGEQIKKSCRNKALVSALYGSFYQDNPNIAEVKKICAELVTRGCYVGYTQDEGTMAGGPRKHWLKTYGQADEFTPTVNNTLAMISLLVAPEDHVSQFAPLTGSLREDIGEMTPETALIVKTFTIPKKYIKMSANWLDISLDVQLDKTKTYWIVIDKQEKSFGNYVWCYLNDKQGLAAYTTDNKKWITGTFPQRCLRLYYSNKKRKEPSNKNQYNQP